MTHWNSELYHFDCDAETSSYEFKGSHTVLLLHYTNIFNYLYITFVKGQRHTGELLVCVKPNGDTLVSLEKYDPFFIRFIVHGQRYKHKKCKYHPFLLKEQSNIISACLESFDSYFYIPVINQPCQRIQMKDWVYTYSQHSDFQALIVVVHWKNLTRRKLWLRKYEKFCNQVSFYPYFWKNLVYYLY